LLILTSQKLDLKGQDDIKKVISPEFLLKELQKDTSMFGWVTKKQSAPKKGEGFSASVLVDISKAFFFDEWDCKE